MQRNRLAAERRAMIRRLPLQKKDLPTFRVRGRMGYMRRAFRRADNGRRVR